MCTLWLHGLFLLGNSPIGVIPWIRIHHAKPFALAFLLYLRWSTQQFLALTQQVSFKCSWNHPRSTLRIQSISCPDFTARTVECNWDVVWHGTIQITETHRECRKHCNPFMDPSIWDMFHQNVEAAAKQWVCSMHPDHMSVRTCNSWIRMNQLLKNTEFSSEEFDGHISLKVSGSQATRWTLPKIPCFPFIGRPLNCHGAADCFYHGWRKPTNKSPGTKKLCDLRCSGYSELIASLLADCRTSFCVTKLALLDSRFSSIV